MKRACSVFFLSLLTLSVAPASAFANCTRAEFQQRANKIAKKNVDLSIEMLKASNKTNAEAMESMNKHPHSSLYSLLNMAGSLVKLTWRTAPLRPRSFFLDLAVRNLKKSCGKEYNHDYLAARVVLELTKRKDELDLPPGSTLVIIPDPSDRRVNHENARKIASRAQPAKDAKASIQARIRDAR